MTRLRAAALAAVLAGASCAASGCGPKAPPPPPAPPPALLHLEPACDLVAAAGLEWLVDARPRAIAEIADLIPAIALVVPEARFAAFAAAHGGVDVRQVKDLCVAKYGGSVVSVARTQFDAARVERAFGDRVTRPGGRAVEVPNPPVVRLWGEVTGEPQQVVLFGGEALALEQGKPGPARIASAFAQGKLRRATPALHGAALARANELLGDAPARLFVPGPFEGETASGLGGLLRGTTAVGVSARFVGSAPSARAGADARAVHVAVRVVLTGAWGKDAQAAAERLKAAAHVVAESALGRLLGADKPLVEPVVRGSADALVLDATVDAMALARGLRDAAGAEIAEIMGR